MVELLIVFLSMLSLLVLLVLGEKLFTIGGFIGFAIDHWYRMRYAERVHVRGFGKPSFRAVLWRCIREYRRRQTWR